ncbi:hypothetical protein BDN70DRAFT_935268 [Pholiota conissans]|uniref:Uncharacterized protein n=1 Tax=Pholiota conissans TaxID=109636 RepID=A0A9P6CRG1_9AGAR|nr:hypothetical protein BDN70DRAFT_935268 [Pholiota conissans]
MVHSNVHIFLSPSSILAQETQLPSSMDRFFAPDSPEVRIKEKKARLRAHREIELAKARSANNLNGSSKRFAAIQSHSNEHLGAYYTHQNVVNDENPETIATYTRKAPNPPHRTPTIVHCREAPGRAQLTNMQLNKFIENVPSTNSSPFLISLFANVNSNLAYEHSPRSFPDPNLHLHPIVPLLRRRLPHMKVPLKWDLWVPPWDAEPRATRTTFDAWWEAEAISATVDRMIILIPCISKPVVVVRKSLGRAVRVEDILRAVFEVTSKNHVHGRWGGLEAVAGEMDIWELRIYKR